MDNVIQGQPQAKLNVCGCGSLHFTYGPITLHFCREEFQAFAQTVGRLASQVSDVEDNHDPMTIAPTRPDTVCH